MVNGRCRKASYKAPSETMSQTTVLVRGFILRPQMTYEGKMQSTVSAKTLSEQCAYVEFWMMSPEIHVPSAPEYRDQKYEVG